MDEINKIFLWGPAGSGKTWLLNSFIRKINLLRMAFNEEENGKFDLWVEDESSLELEVTELTRKPTERSDYQVVVYRRSVKATELDLDLFSNHHVIGMLDGPGDETTGQIEKEKNTTENKRRVAQARAALMEADYLFVVVHPGKHAWATTPDGKEEDVDKAGEHFINRLNALLKLQRRPDQRVFLCFTQADNYGMGLGGLNAALAHLFGPRRGSEIGIKLKKLCAPMDSDPPLYYLSAVGYYRDPDNQRIPNHDASSQTLSDDSKWNPYKILEPFFDVFDEVQRKHLKNTIKPKSLFRPFLQGVILHDRLALYEKYSNREMLREGEKKISRLFGW